MSVTAVERFENLLEEERAAARVADYERLLALQDDKRAAMSDLAGTDDETLDRLTGLASENIALMRHLVAVLHAVVGGGTTQTYGAEGSIREAQVGRKRGAL